MLQSGASYGLHEITAMTMVLNYYGYPADKVEMATEYLPVVSANLYYGDDGPLYGPT